MPCVSVLPGQPASVCLTCHKMLSTKALGKDCTSHTILLLKSSFPHLCPITMVHIEVQDHDLHTRAADWECTSPSLQLSRLSRLLI